MVVSFLVEIFFVWVVFTQGMYSSLCWSILFKEGRKEGNASMRPMKGPEYLCFSWVELEGYPNVSSCLFGWSSSLPIMGAHPFGEVIRISKKRKPHRILFSHHKSC